MEPRYMLQGKLSGKLMRELAGGDEHRLWRLFCVSPGEGEGEFVHAILARHGLHTFVVPGLRNLIGVNTKQETVPTIRKLAKEHAGVTLTEAKMEADDSVALPYLQLFLCSALRRHFVDEGWCLLQSSIAKLALTTDSSSIGQFFEFTATFPSTAHEISIVISPSVKRAIRPDWPKIEDCTAAIRTLAGTNKEEAIQHASHVLKCCLLPTMDEAVIVSCNADPVEFTIFGTNHSDNKMRSVLKQTYGLTIPSTFGSASATVLVTGTEKRVVPRHLVVQDVVDIRSKTRRFGLEIAQNVCQVLSKATFLDSIALQVLTPPSAGIPIQGLGRFTTAGGKQLKRDDCKVFSLPKLHPKHNAENSQTRRQAAGQSLTDIADVSFVSPPTPLSHTSAVLHINSVADSGPVIPTHDFQAARNMQARRKRMAQKDDEKPCKRKLKKIPLF